MARATHASLSNTERGWAFVVVLVALAIVAFLARDALSSYVGVVRNGAATTGKRLPATAIVPDPASTTPLVSPPIERARNVESLVEQGAASRAKAIDGQAR